jgi:hypothetical protein
MPAILQLLVGLLTGKAGEQIGGAVSKAAQLAALVGVVAPIFLWLTKNKEGIFIEITYGDLAFWGTLISVIVLLTIRLVHRADPPA